MVHYAGEDSGKIAFDQGAVGRNAAPSLWKKAAFDMPEIRPEGLRDYLEQEAPDLATVARNLWLKSIPLHDRQNSPDSNENGRPHIETVERNIWRLLTETRRIDGRLKLENLKQREIFLLSAAACCHDFDKALKSGQPLPQPFQHGEGSAEFVKRNAVALGIDEHQANDIAAAISLHDLKSGPFQKKLAALPTNQLTPDGPINLRRVAVLLKAADMLHCDYSRIPALGIDPEKLAEDKDEEKRKLARSKYLARKCTRGWVTDGTCIFIQADPDNAEETEAFSATFQYMSMNEWKAVAGELEHMGFPHLLDRYDGAVGAVTSPHDDEAHAEPTPHQADPGDLIPGYPEPQDKWVGRKKQMGKLRRAWGGSRRRMQVVVGFGGEGKTALARRFTESLRRAGDEKDRPLVVWWSFYLNKAADAFFEAVLTHFGIPLTEQGHPLAAEQRARKLVDLLRTGAGGRRLLLVLDGLETLQESTFGREGRVTDTGLRELLRATLNDAEPDAAVRGMILITTRDPLSGLRRERDLRYGEMNLEELSVLDGVALLIEQYGLKIEQDDAERFVKDIGGHALTLTLTGALHAELPGNTNLAELRQFIAGQEAKVVDPELTTRRERFHRLPGYVLRHCADALNEQERQFLRLLSCCVRPATRLDVEQVFLHPLTSEADDEPFNDQLVGLDYVSLRTGVAARLVKLRLVHGREVDAQTEGEQEETGYDMHPLVRRHFYEDDPDTALTEPQRRAVHSRFYDVLPGRQEKHHPDTMEEMRPLIDAVQHGCRAGRTQAALHECYYTRIGRKDQPLRIPFYLSSNLGAIETQLELLRSFFAHGDFAGEPIVTREGDEVYLIGAAALSLLTTGRPDLAIPLFQRAFSVSLAQASRAGASAICQNLCEGHMTVGGLADAAEAASDALKYVGEMPDEHQFKNAYTEINHGWAATIAALRGDDEGASGHFAAAIKFARIDWLVSLRGCSHCAWLARRGEFDRARATAENNTEQSEQVGHLTSQTFALATQALVERQAWATNDPQRAGLELMADYARRAVDIGRRSGYDFFLTIALLEAGRCGVTRARHDSSDRQVHVAEATRFLNKAEQRADDAGYRLILADLHLARAELAKLAGDKDAMREHCAKAIAICDAPDCGYAWAKQDAQALLDP
ncbi:MAG: ATP-binding protein [Planctomycetota bacterium]|nr:ATP-binding protein [Planctomycetota bacterium]